MTEITFRGAAKPHGAVTLWQARRFCQILRNGIPELEPLQISPNSGIKAVTNWRRRDTAWRARVVVPNLPPVFGNTEYK